MKHIFLDISESLTEDFDTLLNGLGVELSYTFDSSIKYDLVFTQNVDFKSEQGTTVIYILEDNQTCEGNVIYRSSLVNAIVKKSLRRRLGDQSSIDLENEFKPIEMRTFKITSKNSIGFYLDQVLTFAQKYDFTTIQIVDDYLKLVSGLAVKENILPIGLDILVNEETFVLQLSVDFLGEISIETEKLNASFIDSYQLQETGVSAFGVSYFKGVFSKSRLKTNQLASVEGNFNNVVYKTLSNLVDYKKEDILKINESKSSLAMIKKIVDFIVHVKDFQNIEFSKLLDLYPDKIIVAGLNEEDRSFIKKVISDKNLLETMNISIRGHEDELYENQDLPEKISRAISAIDVFQIKSIMGEEDFKTKISGVTQDLTEENQRVSGRIDEDDSFTRISGTPEEVDNSQTKIAGVTDDVSRTRWELKRLNLGKKLEDQLKRVINSETFTKKTLEERIESVVGEVFETDDAKFKKEIKQMIMQSAAVEDLSVKISNETSSENVFLQLENDRYRGQVAKKNDQIIRMKKIIDTMKEEFIARSKAQSEIGQKLESSANQTSGQRLDSASIQIDALLREVKIKDARIEQLEKANAHTIKNKDQRIMQLEEKISDFVNAPAKADNSAEVQVRVTELEHHNKILENQLAVAEERIQSLSKKYDAELKNRAQINSTSSELSKILEEEKRKNLVLVKQVEVFESASKNKSTSVDEVAVFKERVKELETSLKESQLEGKKFEQKMKFMTSQMTEMDKKFKKLSGASGSSAQASVGDKKAKQLELALEKINALKTRAEEELIKKKEEAQKLKQENTALQHKLDEFERKMAKFEKKAA